MKTIKGKAVYENLAEMVAPRRTAVLVIDMQNEACVQQGYFARIGANLAPVAAIVKPLAAFLDTARARGVRVVYLQQTTLRDGNGDSPAWLHLKEIAYRLKAPADGPQDDYMIEGGWGHQFVDGLQPRPSDIVVPKYRASGFIHTPLEQLLRSNGIESLVVAGTSSYGCVLATIMDASCLDFYVILVRDLIAGPNQELHAAALKLMQSRFDLADSGALTQQWRSTT